MSAVGGVYKKKAAPRDGGTAGVRPVLRVSNNKGNQSVMLSSPAANLCSPWLMRSACRRRGTDRPLR